jgi:uncharacterized protein
MLMRAVVAGSALLAAVFAAAWGALPGIGAGGLLHPGRRISLPALPEHCLDVRLPGAGVTLSGWRCSATDSPRGTVVYLHGIADNRGSATGVIRRFLARGFDVVAYDGRAHGTSEGEACTYGFFEKQDLHRVIDGLPPGPVVLIGTSLGAAVALQEAADDPRVAAVVAAETFSDLRTVASERAPFFFTSGTIAKAFSLAETQGRFRVDDVQPWRSAARITAPVLLIHGADDVETRPAHSERVFQQLAGPRRLIMVPRAGHNGSLRSDVWVQIEEWIDASLPPRAAKPIAAGTPGAGTRTSRRSSR